MENPIHLKGVRNNYPLEFLKILIIASKKLNIKNIILPCVDKSTLKKNKIHKSNLIKNILVLKNY